MGKGIVVYFSRAGQNYFGGQIRSIAEGNTSVAAQIVAEAAGADLKEIAPAAPYPNDYQACVDLARAEHADDARPQVREIPDITSYDVVYLGFPNWCGTIPMCVATVLDAWRESGDVAGKKIMPFCTNEGSGMGSSERDIQRLCPGADVARGLPITGSRAASCAAAVKRWIA